MSDLYLNLKYEGAIYSSVRETVASSRYMEKLREEGLVGNADGNFTKGSFVMITDGDKTFFGGEGRLFEEFIQTRQLNGYVGQGQPISTVHQQNYDSAQLAMVRFDQSFNTLPYDARRPTLFNRKLQICTRCQRNVQMQGAGAAAAANDADENVDSDDDKKQDDGQNTENEVGDDQQNSVPLADMKPEDGLSLKIEDDGIGTDDPDVIILDGP